MANLLCDLPPPPPPPHTHTLFSEKNDNKEKVAYGQVTLNTEDRCSDSMYGSVLI